CVGGPGGWPFLTGKGSHSYGGVYGSGVLRAASSPSTIATPGGTWKRKNESSTCGFHCQFAKRNSIPTPPGSFTKTRTSSPEFSPTSRYAISRASFKPAWLPDSPPSVDLDAPRSSQ